MNNRHLQEVETAQEKNKQGTDSTETFVIIFAAVFSILLIVVAIVCYTYYRKRRFLQLSKNLKHKEKKQIEMEQKKHLYPGIIENQN